MTGSSRHDGRYGMYTSEKLAATGVTAEPSTTATAACMLRLDRDGNLNRLERERGVSIRSPLRRRLSPFESAVQSS